MNSLIHFLRGNTFQRLALFLAFLLPAISALHSVLSGNIAFWYDPARDLMLASDNIHKLTLIGPTSGIPGIFYGPYWIWLLSLAELLSKDPRIVALLVQTIPYLIIFPLILWTYKKLFGTTMIISLWLLFIFSFNNYPVQLWNPNLAPLLFLAVISLITFTSYTKNTMMSYLKILLAGFIAGLAVNFHISFGIGIITGSLVYFFVDFLLLAMKDKHQWKTLLLNRVAVYVLFLTGICVVYIPFFLFEIRHGFMQIHTIITTLTAHGSVVTQVGLSKGDILAHFFGRTGILFQVPTLLGYLIEIVLLIMGLFFIIRHYKEISDQERKMLTYVGCVGVSVISIYLASKNPVWEYHFIASEIVFLLLVGFVISKYRMLMYVFTTWVGIICILSIGSFVRNLNANPYNTPSLAIDEHIAKLVIHNAHHQPYTIFAYNPAIYMYDYAYLFNWLDNKHLSYDPGMIEQHAPLVYLIIPHGQKELIEDFIQHRTTDKEYKTIASWNIPDGTVILKREKILK